MGSLDGSDKPRYIGKCSNPNCRICKDRDVYDDYEYYDDKWGNVFCTEECAYAFYELTRHAG